MDNTKNIWCCGCEGIKPARLTNGMEIYPHRHDLAELPFWICDICGSFVGCHHKTKNRTAPLGFMATPEMRKLRQEIHSVLDPLWKKGSMSRSEVYLKFSERIRPNKKAFHTARIKTIRQARYVLTEAKEFIRGQDNEA